MSHGRASQIPAGHETADEALRYARGVEARTTRTRRRTGGPMHDPQPGMAIGRYTIVRLIARGGVGLVYLARQAVSNAAVVVKVLAGNLIGDAETTARFDREAQRLRGIQHPNIVAMVDYGHSDGSAYLVMEYLEGELLGAYATRKGPLALAEFTPIAAQILKAIGYAHTQGLMHRDLKPSNIMLCSRKGRANFVKILDFGMAKLIEGERDITSEQIVGTANYLSPEQIRGEAIDARVDVYAIGVLFYALLAGRLPFNADNNAALLYKHVHEPPPPLADNLPAGHDIPPELVALVHRCLTKEVAQRPADANVVVAGLVACVPGELFHLPVAEGGSATPSSSYAVLPTDVEAGPEDLSGRLTRPVQSLRAAQTGKAATTSEGSPAPRTGPITGPITGPRTGPITASTGRARPRNRVAQPRPITLPPGAMVTAPPQTEGGRLWLVLAGGVLLALLGLGGYLLSNAGRGTETSPDAPVLDERRLSARLEQVEVDLLGGEFERARAGLDAAEASLVGVPQLRSRADLLRRRLDVATTIATAQALEKDGNTAAALSSYRDALALDPNHAEARASLARLSAPNTPTPTPTPTRPQRSRGEPRPGEPRRVERPVVGPSEVVAPAEPVPAKPVPVKPVPAKPDDGLLGDNKEDDSVFLPVD